jgi:2-iminobutanoate/2-iminopropanoate deaminase
MKRLALLALCLAPALLAVEPAPPLKTDRYQRGPGEDEFGYREAVRVGNTLYISGNVGKGPMPDAIRQTYESLGKVLAHYGLTFQHVVKETVFTTQLDALKENRAVRREFYGKEYPASSWIQIDRLFQPEYVIEVELVAVFPE